jgi:hypothetical protein
MCSSWIAAKGQLYASENRSIIAPFYDWTAAATEFSIQRCAPVRELLSGNEIQIISRENGADLPDVLRRSGPSINLSVREWKAEEEEVAKFWLGMGRGWLRRELELKNLSVEGRESK